MDGYYESSAKRSHSHYDDDEPDRNSRSKRRHVSDSEQPPPLDTEYRILCPGSKIGGVIGKGGSIIKALRQDTRARIIVEDSVSGSDERVIYVRSSSGKDRDRDGRSRDRDRDREEMLCPAQEALFKIHTRITEGEGPASDEDEDEPPRQVTARLLVPDNQIGCVIGKGGRIIEQMRKDIGAQIRVLPKESLPPCASPNDELVQLSGDPALVRKALFAISSRLYENPPRERTSAYSQGVSVLPGGSLYSSSNMLSSGGSYMGFGNYGGAAWPVPTGAGAPRSDGASDDVLSVRVLCPNEKIGSMIGKGGNVIRKLREESGAKIKVGEPVSDADERIIEISSSEYIESFVSPAIEAALQVQRRLADLMAEKDSSNGIVTARLLVPSNQIGCLLGKGGQIITEMRKTSRANIRIPQKDELPSIAGENDELVQISGEQPMVEAALLQVLNRLRSNLFKGRDLGPGIPLLGMSYQGSGPVMSTYRSSHDSGSPGRTYSYSGAGLSSYGDYDTSPTKSRRSSKESRRRQR